MFARPLPLSQTNRIVCRPPSSLFRSHPRSVVFRQVAARWLDLTWRVRGAAMLHPRTKTVYRPVVTPSPEHNEFEKCHQIVMLLLFRH
jgi:hypothetical protein